MNTYLLAWNSKRWQWKDLPEFSDLVKDGKFEITRWSCGNCKRLQEGDRIFLIRLGEEPKGIIASGTITKGSYEDGHWDESKRLKGKKSFFVHVQFDTLLNPEMDNILNRRLLDIPPFSQMHWDTQMSGIQIPDNIAEELEKVWKKYSIIESFFFFPEEVDENQPFYEGAVNQIYVNAYERNLQARKKCIDHYGPICYVCGFDFCKFYGIVGKEYIHVHHLKELSEIGYKYKIDPIKDLRPICPNCHAIIHRRNPPYTIKEIQEFITQAKNN